MMRFGVLVLMIAWLAVSLGWWLNSETRVSAMRYYRWTRRLIWSTGIYFALLAPAFALDADWRHMSLTTITAIAIFVIAFKSRCVKGTPLF